MVDYGVILPKAVLDVPHWGCFNLHPSLLPRWRGSAPVQRAIAAGDEKIGLSIALLEETVDAGPIAVQQSWSMPTNMTASEVLRFLSEQGAKALCRMLDALSREGGKCDLHLQSAEGVCMAGKLTRAEGRIDWSKSAEQLERQVRAFHPWPGSWFLWRNQRVLLLSCRVAGSSGPFGMPPGMFHGEDLNCVWSWELAASIVALCRRTERIHARLALRTPSCTRIDIAMSCGSAQERTSPT